MLFLEYEFIIVYKPGITHVVVDTLSILLDNLEPLGVVDQIMDALVFSIELIWTKEIKSYLGTNQMPKTFNLV